MHWKSSSYLSLIPSSLLPPLELTTVLILMFIILVHVLLFLSYVDSSINNRKCRFAVFMLYISGFLSHISFYKLLSWLYTKVQDLPVLIMQLYDSSLTLRSVLLNECSLTQLSAVLLMDVCIVSEILLPLTQQQWALPCVDGRSSGVQIQTVILGGGDVRAWLQQRLTLFSTKQCESGGASLQISTPQFHFSKPMSEEWCLILVLTGTSLTTGQQGFLFYEMLVCILCSFYPVLFWFIYDCLVGILYIQFEC